MTESAVPGPVRLIAVCHTGGCPAEGQECPGVFYPYGEFDPPRFLGQCGRCEQPLTDLRPCPDHAPEDDGGNPPAPAPTPVPVQPETAEMS